MEQITRSAAADLPHNLRDALANHLRSVDRNNRNAWAAPDAQAFQAAVAASVQPGDVCANAYALDNGLIRPEWVPGPRDTTRQSVFALTGKGKAWLAAHRPASQPVASLRPLGPAKSQREPLMGERLLVAELAKAA